MSRGVLRAGLGRAVSRPFAARMAVLWRGDPGRHLVRRFGIGVATVVAVSGLAACSGPPPSASSQLQSWAKMAGYPASTARIESDLVQIRRWQAKGNAPQAKLDCIGMGSDAGRADNQLPTPDKALTTILNAGYSAYFDYAAECQRSKGIETPAMVALAVAGQHDLAEAAAMYQTAARVR